MSTQAAAKSHTSLALQTVAVPGSLSGARFRVPASWRLLRHLGSGSYASVAAFEAPGAEPFAVKKVERVFDHPVLALRTLREVRLLAHLRHPNILGLQEVFVEGPSFDDVYLCLDHMEADLHQVIHRGKEPLSDYQVQCILYQILRGLLCLRRARVVHRDLKPGNVLVMAGGEVRIADFGLARSIDAEEDSNDTAVLTEYVVTRFYRAPEVVLTATHYTYAVDMWSTGCILGEMLTRRPVFEGKDALDQIRKIVSVMGGQPAAEMSWIPASSPSWAFVERCNKEAGAGNFQRLLRWPGANPQATDLLAEMLRFNPSRRIAVDAALDHAYLEAFGAEDDPEVAAARAMDPVDWRFDHELCVDDAGRPQRFDLDLFRRAFDEAFALASATSSCAAASAPTAAAASKSDREAEGSECSTKPATSGRFASARGATARKIERTEEPAPRQPHHPEPESPAESPWSAASPVRRRWGGPR